MNTPSFFLLTLTLGLLTSCGKAPPMPEPQFEQVQLPLDGSNIVGPYKAEFVSVNENTVGYTNPTSYIIRNQDNLVTHVSVPKSGPHVWHQQDIYLDGRCPTGKDDKNDDGIVDHKEASEVMGKIIIPLDGNLESQSTGSGVYPIGNQDGAYYYKRSVDLKSLLSDLRETDTDLADEVIKLRKTQGLSLEGAIVVILGAHDSTNLPATVATSGGHPSHRVLPVACGLYVKTTSVPPGTDMGESGPVGTAAEAVPVPIPPTPLPPDVPVPEQPLPGEEPQDDDQDDDWTDRWDDWWDDRWPDDGRSPDSSGRVER
ncbi:MAG TPA: hypothetical protein VNJ01_11305 [Bacteriovoracaceae bacterium]|nr:hypothetical protein [Bacteriovoracaceae bacterium]